MTCRGIKKDAPLLGALFFSLFVCISAATYLAVGITLFSSVVSALFTVGIFCAIVLYWRGKTVQVSEELPVFPSSIFSIATLTIQLGCISLLLYTLWGIRTDEAIQSPWTHVAGVRVFGLFVLSTVILLFESMRKRSQLFFFSSGAHFLVMYGVALIAFRYGYGYDPIIHQTAELHVVAHGRIFPIQPMYLGQYALVAVLHFITSIPVEFVDRGLLPILAGLSVPLVAYYGLTRGYGMTPAKALFSTILLSLYPFSELTFTVPHNLTVLYALWWVFLFPLIGKGKIETLTLFLIAIAACLTHPLLGIPLFLASLLALWNRWWKGGVVSSASRILIGVLMIAGAVISMLGAYRLLHGEAFFFLTDIWQETQSFFSFFSFPQFREDSSWQDTVLSWYKYLAVQGSIVVGLGSLLQKRIPTWIRMTIASIGCGIIVAMYVMTLAIRIPGIAEYEQFEFILRLRDVLAIFFLPLILHLGSKVSIKKFQRAITVVIIALLGVLSATSLVTAYPRLDGSHTRIGWNASAADLSAVKQIEKRSGKDEYVVLSDQIFAVVGLRAVGFERTFKNREGDMMHYYSISPSEVLYPYSIKALYDELSSDLFIALRYRIGRRDIYLVVHDYWYRAAEIEQEARLLGGKRIPSSKGIRVFLFK